MQALASHLCLSPPPAPRPRELAPWTRREEREPHATHLLPEACALLATPGKLAGWELRTPERGAVLKDSE